MVICSTLNYKNAEVRAAGGRARGGVGGGGRAALQLTCFSTRISFKLTREYALR
jgi:hypothetical protein